MVTNYDSKIFKKTICNKGGDWVKLNCRKCFTENKQLRKKRLKYCRWTSVASEWLLLKVLVAAVRRNCCECCLVVVAWHFAAVTSTSSNYYTCCVEYYVLYCSNTKNVCCVGSFFFADEVSSNNLFACKKFQVSSNSSLIRM